MSVGTRLKRKNTVGIDEFIASDTFLETNTGKQGRPSQGGDLIKAKRYYVKNHMLILHKRKLKRYHDKVKKWLLFYEHDPHKIMKAFETSFSRYTKDHHHFFYAINQLREDGYVRLLNEEAERYLGERFGIDPEKEQVLAICQTLTDGHLLLLFKLCTLFSAFLLASYLKKECGDDREKLESVCSQEYMISYAHIK